MQSSRAGGSQEFTLNSKFKEDKVDQEVSASYKAAKYAIKASVSPAGKVSPRPCSCPSPSRCFLELTKAQVGIVSAEMMEGDEWQRYSCDLLPEIVYSAAGGLPVWRRLLIAGLSIYDTFLGGSCLQMPSFTLESIAPDIGGTGASVRTFSRARSGLAAEASLLGGGKQRCFAVEELCGPAGGRW